MLIRKNSQSARRGYNATTAHLRCLSVLLRDWLGYGCSRRYSSSSSSSDKRQWWTGGASIRAERAERVRTCSVYSLALFYSPVNSTAASACQLHLAENTKRNVFYSQKMPNFQQCHPPQNHTSLLSN